MSYEEMLRFRNKYAPSSITYSFEELSTFADTAVNDYCLQLNIRKILQYCGFSHKYSKKLLVNHTANAPYPRHKSTPFMEHMGVIYTNLTLEHYKFMDLYSGTNSIDTALIENKFIIMKDRLYEYKNCCGLNLITYRPITITGLDSIKIGDITHDFDEFYNSCTKLNQIVIESDYPHKIIHMQQLRKVRKSFDEYYQMEALSKVIPSIQIEKIQIIAIKFCLRENYYNVGEVGVIAAKFKAVKTELGANLQEFISL